MYLVRFTPIEDITFWQAATERLLFTFFSWGDSLVQFGHATIASPARSTDIATYSYAQ